MKLLRRAALVLALLLAAGLAWVLVQAQRHPGLPAAGTAFWRPAPVPAQTSRLRVTFVGVSTLLFDDGETAWMTDGFFSRPSLRDMLARRLETDRGAVERGLQRLGVKHLAAVVPLHTHYDHAMDSALVAQLSGAQLVGSSSALQLGRGQGLPEDRMREVKPGETLQFGRFKLSFFESRHSPTAWTREGAPTQHIETVLRQPAHASAFKEGTVWSLLVEHDGRRLLVQASAGFVPGALQGQHADVVYLGVGTLGLKDSAYVDAYWHETVTTLGARRILPIHWDDFWRSPDDPTEAMPLLFDDFAATMRELQARGTRDGVDVKLPPLWRPMDPFAGIPGSASH